MIFVNFELAMTNEEAAMNRILLSKVEGLDTSEAEREKNYNMENNIY